jgi:hypothetical protein
VCLEYPCARRITERGFGAYSPRNPRPRATKNRYEPVGTVRNSNEPVWSFFPIYVASDMRGAHWEQGRGRFEHRPVPRSTPTWPTGPSPCGLRRCVITVRGVQRMLREKVGEIQLPPERASRLSGRASITDRCQDGRPHGQPGHPHVGCPMRNEPVWSIFPKYVASAMQPAHGIARPLPSR